jgi:hypothetical protein
MKKRTLKIILVHVLIWLALSVLCVFIAEPIIKSALPGVYEVEHWLMTVMMLMVIVFIGTILSLIIWLKRKRV